MKQSKYLYFLFFCALFCGTGISFFSCYAQNQNSENNKPPQKYYPNARYNIKDKSNSQPKKEYPDPKGILTFYPFALVGSRLMFSYENVITSKIGLKGNLSYGVSETNIYYDVKNMKGVSLETQLRFYPGSSAIKGLYGAGYFQYKQMSFDAFSNGFSSISAPDLKNLKVNAMSFGAVFGYQAVLGGIFVIDMYAGGGLISPNLGNARHSSFSRDNFFDSYNAGVGAHLGLSLGLVLY